MKSITDEIENGVPREICGAPFDFISEAQEMNTSYKADKTESRRFCGRASWVFPVLSAITVFTLYTIILKINGVAAFSQDGAVTLLWNDAYYQYADFLAWMKDVLDGKQSLFYSFHCGLGQSTVGLFAYYLASPFNLLLYFFDKTELHIFISLVLALKLSCGGAFMALYLQKRYQTLHDCFVWGLSVSYALMQYSFSQGSNSMWLDGVYMLPLVLLGVYHLQRDGRGRLLSIAIALSVLLNWYTGGINCLAAAIFFAAEYFLANGAEAKASTGADSEKYAETSAAGSDKNLEQEKVQRGAGVKAARLIEASMRLVCSVGIGLLISAVLFLPAVWDLRQGKGSGLDWGDFRPIFTGNLLSFLHTWSSGEVSEYGYPALFCGAAVLIGCIGLFSLKTLSRREKLVYGAMLLFSLLIFYWQPFFLIFSLLKNAESYYYRYAYVANAALIFVAARFFSEITESDEKQLLKGAGGIFILILLLDYAVPHEVSLLFNLGLEILIAVFLLVIALRRRWHGRLCAAALLGIWCIDLVLNGCFVQKKYLGPGVEVFASYNRNQQELVEEVRELDQESQGQETQGQEVQGQEVQGQGAEGQEAQGQETQDQETSPYRMTQLMTRSMNYRGPTANLNESMAFGYLSVENYTSCPQNRQLRMMEKLGYPVYMDCLLAKNAFLLPVDTLLSVKYLLSPYSVPGMVRRSAEADKKNGKEIYQNPFALPLAFTAESLSGSPLLTHDGLESENPFEYWNAVYRALSGSETPVMERLEYTEEKPSGNQVTYHLQLPDGMYAVFGNIPTSEDLNATLNLNQVLTIPYSRLHSVKVFAVPGPEETEKREEVTISLKAEHLDKIQEVQFYGLNLEAFREVTEAIQSRGAERVAVGKTRVEITADGKAGELLFTSIPYDEGWEITNNGRKVRPELFENCLICLPLEEGENHLVFQHHVKWLLPGAALTLLGLILLFLTDKWAGRQTSGKREE